MGIGQDLLGMKESIAQAKTEKAQTEGALKIVMDRLQKDYGLSSYEEAVTSYENLQEQCETEELALKEIMEELRDKFDV